MDSYEQFKININRLINIDLNYYKEKQMKRRIFSLLSRNGFKDFDDYFETLKKNRELLDQFINYMTINVSEFYRNPSQWEVLEKELIPRLMSGKRTPLKIWSAACSTGEEPYSFVMLLSRFYDLKDIKILATDIDEGAMQKAKEGLYTTKALANLPADFKKKFFSPQGSFMKIDDKVKKCVEFKKMDLLKERFSINMDLISCRNVMIYFTDEAKENLYMKFNNALQPNGIFFVGSTEQIIGPERYNFQTARTFFYEKIKK